MHTGPGSDLAQDNPGPVLGGVPTLVGLEGTPCRDAAARLTRCRDDLGDEPGPQHRADQPLLGPHGDGVVGEVGAAEPKFHPERPAPVDGVDCRDTTHTSAASTAAPGTRVVPWTAVGAADSGSSV